MLLSLFKQYPRVSTDTRKIQKDDIFFALRGPNFNGNQFAQTAIETHGASYAVIDDPQYQFSDRCILVQDALKELQNLATAYRQSIAVRVVAITGSNGKTTTKEITAAVLAKKYKVFATQGNFNNHIGVPLTLLSMPLDTQIAVVEMGDNKLGDITELCQIAAPDAGVITNIGKDHIEGFGDFEGNIRAKSELFQYLLQTGGTAFINADDYILNNMAKRFKKPIMYSRNDLRFVAANPFICFETKDKDLIQTQLFGAYNFENILTALSIGKYFGVDEKEAFEAISNYVPTNNRSQIIEKQTNTIVLDAYNANPSSVEVALSSFAAVDTDKRKVVLLGDMLELGTISEAEHLRIVEMAVQYGFDTLAFCGENFCGHKRENAHFFASKADLADFLKENQFENSMILLKGSRGMRMETLVEFL